MVETKKDWTRKEIISALHKNGTTLAALSREYGYKSTTLCSVFFNLFTKGEMIIANRLGVTPSEIWPSRYFDRKGNLIKRRYKNKQRYPSRNK
ncbi:helix-turn-helix transcriptional regulator (plasmid) [Arsenophonus sp. aPb]|uniref:helix-turn-helix domain-containing protein n=1 Tax=Arsenophonus sp. aPb TaxID=3041619 RepID=UPI0024690BD5|nr:helix-turn-helix transcriptional regulator [Arsenophonus sp. aPb]WGL99877.1 helix-turn-helix transcriptional regulator [Arsenophonus sp. aPb]